jgi:transcriptional regulator
MTEEKIEDIKLRKVRGAANTCVYSVIENQLEILYENQEKILQAIKLLHKEMNKDEIAIKRDSFDLCD